MSKLRWGVLWIGLLLPFVACAGAPAGRELNEDHLADMVLPLEAFGSDYVGFEPSTVSGYKDREAVLVDEASSPLEDLPPPIGTFLQQFDAPPLGVVAGSQGVASSVAAFESEDDARKVMEAAANSPSLFFFDELPLGSTSFLSGNSPHEWATATYTLGSPGDEGHFAVIVYVHRQTSVIGTISIVRSDGLPGPAELRRLGDLHQAQIEAVLER